MSVVNADSGTSTILLRPRPFALRSGSFLLLPLLPEKEVAKHLPSEIWTQILYYAITQYNQHEKHLSDNYRLGLLLISKTLKDVALPLYYSDVHITNPASLKRFTGLLHAADQKWDSIRRIPYSAPGRWVRTLNLAHMRIGLWEEACLVDALLTQLFPLVPFLQRMDLNNAITLSRRAIDSFSYRDGTQNLRFLKGVKVLSSPLSEFAEDPFMEVLRCSVGLEELAIIGSGSEAIQLGSTNDIEPDVSQLKPLNLPRLHKLSIVSMHSSSVMLCLLHSPLPSLTHLTVTPYDDISIPSSLVPRFIDAHGKKLSSLHLYTHKSWPTILFPSPTTLLHTCPTLRHLSLENPLPTLTICSIYPRHPLQILSLPRPNPEFLSVLETLLPKLPP